VEFRIADSFTDALARLPAQEQKAVKTSAFDLQLDPTAPGLQLHRVDRSKDPDFWSIRVSRDLRIIVHKTAASFLLAYVDHHDRAYAWAERRRIEAHPKTGAVQIVEVRERVEEAAPGLFVPAAVPAPLPEPALFASLSLDDLLGIGVPPDWVETVQAATESRFFELASHLPAEAAEGLLEFATSGILRRPTPAPVADPFAHPDALRRFRTVESQAELQAALDAPWERWAVFLHPSQRGVVERSYAGPARVAGSAGTGKTVVALHRAVRLARIDPSARVLLTTFSQPLADALSAKLAVLTTAAPALAARITVAPWDRLADELHQLAFGRRPRMASEQQVRSALSKAAAAAAPGAFTERFLVAEFTHVIDAWQVASAAAYAETPRPGRKSRLGAKQRERLWPIFAGACATLDGQDLWTWPRLYARLQEHHAGAATKPFTSIVVDEAQDLGVAELRFLCALAPPGDDALFFAGDLGQRIFQPSFSWKGLGVDVRGRSTTLKVNYRTSHQIREAADRLLAPVVRDMDGREEERKGTISVFDGPVPTIARVADEAAEVTHASAFLKAARADGILAEEIGVFVRSRAQLDRGRSAIRGAGLAPIEIGDPSGPGDRAVRIGTMHLAKGLEFKAVLVLACDADVLPLQERIDGAADEADLDEIYETERQLFYVACTRARDRLLITGIAPASEFLADLEPEIPGP